MSVEVRQATKKSGSHGDVPANLIAVGPLFSAQTAHERFEFAIDTFIAGLDALSNA